MRPSGGFSKAAIMVLFDRVEGAALGAPGVFASIGTNGVAPPVARPDTNFVPPRT